jgi:hypothetical protein
MDKLNTRRLAIFAIDMATISKFGKIGLTLRAMPGRWGRRPGATLRTLPTK